MKVNLLRAKVTFLPLILAATLVAVPISAVAQESPANATDLHAAYCAEIIENDISIDEQALKSMEQTLKSIEQELKRITEGTTPGVADNDALKTEKAKVVELKTEQTKAVESTTANLSMARANLKKLQLYLMPRVLSNVDLLGIGMAQVSAKDDMARIASAVSTCTKQCYTMDQCYSECVAQVIPDLASLQKKVGTCRDLDWLPI